MSDSAALDEREPSRTISKVDAVRHLLHASVRLHFAQEDPFAIQLVVNSCDVLISDYGKRRGIPDAAPFDQYIVPHRKKEFYAAVRRVPNFLKHADKDAQDDLPVPDIVGSNELGIMLNAVRAPAMGVPYTKHLQIFWLYLTLSQPDVFRLINIPQVPELLAMREYYGYHSRGEMLEIALALTAQDPDFCAEKELDLVDARRAANKRP